MAFLQDEDDTMTDGAVGMDDGDEEGDGEDSDEDTDEEGTDDEDESM
jgi:hypothetical protein